MPASEPAYSWPVRKGIGGVWLGLLAAVALVGGCESSAGVTVTGTGRTNQPVVGDYPQPTPEWTTPRPTPQPTLPPPGTLPTPTPSS
jgi:hypothetical protein